MLDCEVSSMSTVSFCQKTIESETVKTSEVFKKTLGTLSETVKEVSHCNTVDNDAWNKGH